MRRSLLFWGIVLLGIILIASLASCVIGYILPPIRPAPTPTPTPIVPSPTIRQIQQAAELATVKYNLSAEISDVRVPDDIRKEFGVKEEILLIAYGEVAAGFDLSKLNEQDVWMDGTRVQLHLPAPEILYTRLDNERTHVVYYNRSWFIDRDLDLEGRARAEAEKAIRQAAMESDVLQQASKYGELFFSNWFYSMGFTEVRVIVN